MTITDKFLTFPVEKAIALTTFEDVATMYQELSQAELRVKSLYEKYRDLAKDEENKGRLGTVLYNLLESIRIASILLNKWCSDEYFSFIYDIVSIIPSKSISSY